VSARISASVYSSHVPAIGAALDLGKTDEPYWQPLFAGYRFSRQWFYDHMPDVIILVYNDHAPPWAAALARSLLGTRPEDDTMLSWAIAFFIVALIAGLLGLTGLAGAAAHIAWILFVVFLALMIVAAFANAMRGRPPV
jgi:uncharacterized membrane protein YtjA (UPF0391 family)